MHIFDEVESIYVSIVVRYDKIRWVTVEKSKAVFYVL